MHDLHVADKIHKLAIEQARAAELKNIKKIVVELGSVIEHGADISAENLEFNLNMLNEGTLADQAEIIINKVSGSDWRLLSISGDEK